MTGDVCTQGGGLPPGGGGFFIKRGNGHLYPGGLGRPPPEIHRILKDTVNKRAVRILLGCILVNN